MNVFKEMFIPNKRWLITGVAGFIGSNILETLLKNDQIVLGMDNFSTGKKKNLDDVKDIVTSSQWNNFEFHDSDICSYESCLSITKNIDYILHQAALGSVPRSIKNPIATHEANVNGFLNILNSAKENLATKLVYASSSSVYGDHPQLPKIETKIGKQLSPYAVTKYTNELYAEVFADIYDTQIIGLRYFNVFGKRQDPNGSYAAVIPKWINSLINSEDVYINGKGDTSRDFCFVDNVVQANVLAALTDNIQNHSIYNIAFGAQTSLEDLFYLIRETLTESGIEIVQEEPLYREYRDGDVKHSLANIDKAKNELIYNPRYSVNQGIKKAISWYIDNN